MQIETLVPTNNMGFGIWWILKPNISQNTQLQSNIVFNLNTNNSALKYTAAGCRLPVPLYVHLLFFFLSTNFIHRFLIILIILFNGFNSIHMVCLSICLSIWWTLSFYVLFGFSSQFYWYFNLFFSFFLLLNKFLIVFNRIQAFHYVCPSVSKWMSYIYDYFVIQHCKYLFKQLFSRLFSRRDLHILSVFKYF